MIADNPKLNFQLLLKISLVAILLCVSLKLADYSYHDVKINLLANLNIKCAFFITLIFILNFYVVAARLYLSYRQFDIPISYVASTKALIAGQLGSLIPVFGQALGQSVQLRNFANISVTTSSFIYVYERIIMAASGLLISLLSAFYLFDSITIYAKAKENLYIGEYFFALLLCSIAAYYFVFDKPIRERLATYCSRRNMGYVSAGIALSVFSWILAASSFMICIYFAEANQLIANVNYKNVFGASLIISFLSSLPITINGWGVREIAAISLLSLVLIPKDIALSCGISVGFFSLLAVFLIAGQHYLMNNRLKSIKLSDLKQPSPNLISNNIQNLDQKIINFIGYSCAVFVLFQAYFVFGDFKININLADMFAICGFIMAVLTYNKGSTYVLPHFQTFIKLSIVAFTLALLVGLFRFGFTNFAFFSKFVGFFILLGYAAIGLILMQNNRQSGFEQIALLMQTILACIVIYKLCVNILTALNLIDLGYEHLNLTGFSGNRNAFAIQLLCVAALQIALLKPKTNAFRSRNYWFLSLLLVGLNFTYSRSAIITTLVLLTVCLALKWVTFAQIKIVAKQILIIITAIFLIEKLFFLTKYIISESLLETVQNQKFALGSMFSNQQYSPATSDPHRMYSIFESLKLWLQTPFFGIGLGGFVKHEISKNGNALVTHNSFVWILTEFGIIGATVFFGYGLVVLRYFQDKIRNLNPKLWDPNHKVILMLLVIFALMANAHEIFYQRIIWFVLGVALVPTVTRGIPAKSL